jgi:hypothetical protein
LREILRLTSEEIKDLKFSTESKRAMTELQSSISSLREGRDLAHYFKTFLKTLNLVVILLAALA